MKRTSQNLILLGGSLLIGIVLCELLLRLLNPLFGALYPTYDFRQFVFSPNSTYTFRFIPGTVPGVEGPAEMRTNAWGIRGDEIPANSYRILALGGSTTLCVVLDQEETWTHLIQAELNTTSPVRTWVGNVGIDGSKLFDAYHQIRDMVPALPRIDTIVLLHGFNDLQYRLIYIDDYAEKLDFLRKKIAPSRDQTPEFLRLRTMKLLSGYLRYSRNAGMREYADFYQKMRLKRQNAALIKRTDPPIADALRFYEETLRLIIDETRRQKIRLVLLTQPGLYRNDLNARERGLLWMGAEGDVMRRDHSGIYYSAPVLARALERYNALTLEICRTENIECIDLAGRLPKTTEIFYDDLHFTEAGSRQVARIVSDALKERPPYQRP